MIAYKLKSFAALLVFVCFFGTQLLAQVSVSDTSGLKQVHNLISRILKNDLKDTARLAKVKLADSTRTKINRLKIELSKAQDTKTPPAIFEKALKLITAFHISKKENDIINASIPGLTNDIVALQKLINDLKKNDTVKIASPGIGSTIGSEKPLQDNSRKIIAVKDSTISALRDTIRSKDMKLVAFIKNAANNSSHTGNNPMYSKIVSVLALLILAGLWFLYFRKEAMYKKLLSEQDHLNTDYQNLNVEYTNLSAAYIELKNDKNKSNPMGASNQNTPQQPEYTPPPVMPLMTNTPTTGKYFFGEAMVTAGPRKNFDTDAKEGDYGLGEDVAGFIIQKDKAFFWVLDGTSDSDKLTKPILTTDNQEVEYFSSRLLAQSIGWNLQQLIRDELPSKFNATLLLQQAIKTTESEWKNKITALDKSDHEALLNALQDRNGVLQCSTTAVFGVLCLDGRLDICRIGDTKIIAYPSSNNFARSTGRQFVTLQQKDDGVSLSFNEFNDVRSQNIQLNGIKTLLVMTDGISNQMETWLKNSNNINFSDRNTREIFAQFKQKTYDDKALCIIQIKE
ncbi:MAG: hypothetical protein JWQ66_160 [Mucilaginibacter sp.]|nr:hypothetical protein [Mucilaginibacter sp.]